MVADAEGGGWTNLVAREVLISLIWMLKRVWHFSVRAMSRVERLTNTIHNSQCFGRERLPVRPRLLAGDTPGPGTLPGGTPGE